MPASYLSPKTRVGRSPIHGRGLFATRPMRRGEIVAIKGGHILDRRTLSKVARRIAASYIQIDDDFYIGAIRRAEVGRNKMYINHSCDPNLGLKGQIAFVARRAIKAGEELTYDWAMEENAPARTPCGCRARHCRKTLTGQDWKSLALQRQYRGYFSTYLQDKIERRRRARRR